LRSLSTASLICQVIASAVSLLLFRHSSQTYRWAWLFLAIGLSLMIGRRIDPLFSIFNTGQYRLTDALLSLPISCFLLMGVVGLKRLLLSSEDHVLALETLSQFDPLTQCLSRTEILFRLREEIDRSDRTGQPFALMELDIDYFKKVNDQYGHEIGDVVLIDLVKHSKEVLRSIDSMGRIGGEEFLILLPETNSDEALLAGERLREHIANSVTETSVAPPIQITISIGVAVFDPAHEVDQERGVVLNTIVKKADMAMYQAKNHGRNQVAICGKPQ
jgi:diguanylate cyclase (GGDEF)-like protein